jgi:hypothetical protein
MNQTTIAPARWVNMAELRTLIAPHEAPCISLYLPTHPGGGSDDAARYAGLVRQVHAALARRGTKHGEAALAEQLATALRPEDWKQGSSGLALFHARDHHVVFHLPMSVPERAVVADSFHVRPLLEYLHANQHYFLLLLGGEHAQLFKGNMSGLVPIDAAHWPVAQSDVVGEKEHERQVSVRSTGHGVGFYGRQRSDGARDEEQAQFLRQVDRQVTQALADERAPLVVAAPDRQYSAYVAISGHPRLLREGVHGNFVSASGRELHERAWPIVQRYVAELEERVLQRYHAGGAADHSSADVSFIARAAVQGRVRELLLARGAALCGTLDRATGALELDNAKPAQTQEDVLDDLAEAVLLRGGDVLMFDAARMPTESPVAATLRW